MAIGLGPRFPAEDSVRERYLAAFARALPGLFPEELRFRMRGILAVTAVDRLEVYQPSPPTVRPRYRATRPGDG